MGRRGALGWRGSISSRNLPVDRGVRIELRVKADDAVAAVAGTHADVARAAMAPQLQAARSVVQQGSSGESQQPAARSRASAAATAAWEWRPVCMRAGEREGPPPPPCTLTGCRCCCCTHHRVDAARREVGIAVKLPGDLARRQRDRIGTTVGHGAQAALVAGRGVALNGLHSAAGRGGRQRARAAQVSMGGSQRRTHSHATLAAAQAM